ncbi:hypothetical protein tb265_48030 [Gemmatimonadetes bacterium T265]|nr:hypothetical protein tb265_48030 [Gemmatimonadetes bacterium T265]
MKVRSTRGVYWADACATAAMVIENVTPDTVIIEPAMVESMPRASSAPAPRGRAVAGEEVGAQPRREVYEQHHSRDADDSDRQRPERGGERAPRAARGTQGDLEHARFTVVMIAPQRRDHRGRRGRARARRPRLRPSESSASTAPA